MITLNLYITAVFLVLALWLWTAVLSPLKTDTVRHRLILLGNRSVASMMVCDPGNHCFDEYWTLLRIERVAVSVLDSFSITNFLGFVSAYRTDQSVRDRLEARRMSLLRRNDELGGLPASVIKEATAAVRMKITPPLRLCIPKDSMTLYPLWLLSK